MAGPFDVDSSTKKSVRKVSNAVIASTLLKCEGNLAATARKLKMRRNTLRDRISTSPDLVVIASDQREGVIDDAETNIFMAAKLGDLPACKFVLSTIGKDRGYGQRSEVTGIGGGPIEATVTYKKVQATPQEALVE